LYLQKVNIHLFISLVIIQSVTSRVTCYLYKWSKWNPPIKNKMGTRTLLSRRRSHLRLQAIKLLASLTYIHSKFVSPHPTAMRPSPHRCRTWHRSPHGQQAQVVPVPEAPIAVARSRRSSPPSPQAWRLCLHMVLKVDNPVGMDIHLLTGDVEQHTGVVPPMLGITKMKVNLL
jgi:hypothetical protein